MHRMITDVTETQEKNSNRAANVGNPPRAQAASNWTNQRYKCRVRQFWGTGPYYRFVSVHQSRLWICVRFWGFLAASAPVYVIRCFSQYFWDWQCPEKSQNGHGISLAARSSFVCVFICLSFAHGRPLRECAFYLWSLSSRNCTCTICLSVNKTKRAFQNAYMCSSWNIWTLHTNRNGPNEWGYCQWSRFVICRLFTFCLRFLFNKLSVCISADP